MFGQEIKMYPIQQYKFRMKNKLIDAYKGSSICVRCKQIFELNTTEPELFNKTLCFKCFMESHRIPCDDCGKLCKYIELNTKRGSNKLICDECANKRNK